MEAETHFLEQTFFRRTVSSAHSEIAERTLGVSFQDAEWDETVCTVAKETAGRGVVRGCSPTRPLFSFTPLPCFISSSHLRRRWQSPTQVNFSEENSCSCSGAYSIQETTSLQQSSEFLLCVFAEGALLQL